MENTIEAGLDDRLARKPSVDNGGAAETALRRTSLSHRAPKKRTKTGCLTCRKRRIKCGEEKPICHHCVKSKRLCEGYAQRVVFKNPLGIIRSHALDQQFPQGQMRVSTFNDYASSLAAQQAAAAAASQHPALAPRPVDPAALEYAPPPLSDRAPPESPQPSSTSHFYYPAVSMQTHLQQWPFQTLTTASTDYSPPPQSTTSSQTTHYNQEPATEYRDQGASSQYPGEGVVSYAGQLPLIATGQSSSEDISPNTNQTTPPIVYHHQSPPGSLQHPLHPHEPFLPQQAQIIYVEDESEDYYDVESDEEMVDQVQAEGFNQLSLIMSSANQDDRQLRSFTTHLNEPNILATYRPTLGSSPLNNPKTARIFVHFIHSTGPSMSMFERHPTDSSIVLGAPVPTAQQGLWTYTLPLKALEHQALLQAILAISSLHISYLQNAPTTVSLKHYHYALKRVGHAVGLPLRRKQIGTLAATLTLGYYEVISADHHKWNSHVAGSAHLIREIDYAGITRDLRAYRRRIYKQYNPMAHVVSWPGGYSCHDPGCEPPEDDPFVEKESVIDQTVLETITGRAMNYDEFGHVDEGHVREPRKHFTRKDIENFRIQCDLYWWYCKQDLIQSLISGNKLFTPYSQWGQCPPRAGLGRLDAIYGSVDHLWLLLGRLTDFGYRDRKRKLKALKAAGKEWTPTPGMFKFMARFAGGSPGQQPGPPGSGLGGAPPPGSAQGNPAHRPGDGTSPTQKTAPPSRDSPPMYGMIPQTGPVRLPSGFTDQRQESRESPEGDNEDSTYNEAEQEWETIMEAFETFSHSLGRDFQPLPADITPPISTPFGPALQYRTHTIAVLWGFYYAGRILLLRLHPSMPPAMMVAAGVAARTTIEYAQNVGKIMAGIYYPQRYNLEAGSLSPTLGTSLTEMTVPVFFAAVQYTDATQRGWTITKLREISRLTGWKSSDAVAAGCENSWVVAARHGRGPPYSRTQYSDRERPGFNAVQRDDVNHDRRFVTVSGSGRLHWAFGILSLEDDVDDMD
ncbi:hypothetical protein N7510_009756 [Penicillium lagena]|uniref:uncharacterized protein n=1 Tax=Penicillium lagena TaxID=94218 RepID=UPI002540EA65|nr:uncharacterized protein N7510_009756 [Penicillium lagena]KAJ5604602.1 hypothetical protein N7510_009756 [Penicillium lagena]